MKPLMVAITGGKGGTGKSTIACSLAIALADKFRVLLVDTDVECPDDHIILSAQRRKTDEVTLQIPSFDFSACSMCGKCSEVCRKNAIVFVEGRHPILVRDRCSGCGTCSLACRNNAIKEEEMVAGFLYDGKLPENYDEKIRRNFRLLSGETTVNIESSARLVDSLMKKAREHHDMDFIIIDTAAGVHCNVIHAIMGAHLAFAVTEPTPFGSHDLKLILELLERLGVTSNIILNRAGIGNADPVLEVSRETGRPIVAEIEYSRDVMEAYSAGEPLKVPGIAAVVELLEMQRC